jgi:uncharacterized protein (DUF427 family)
MSQARRSGWAGRPDYDVHFEPFRGRVRVLFADRTIADSRRVMEMHETEHQPVWYFPRADVDMALLRSSEHESFCPFKGEASYWSIEVDEREAENAVWSYQAPFAQVARIKDYLAFYPDRVDAVLVDGEEAK